jgi:hypothetical protein
MFHWTLFAQRVSHLGFVLRHPFFPPCLSQENVDRIRPDKSDEHADLHHEPNRIAYGGRVVIGDPTLIVRVRSENAYHGGWPQINLRQQ